MLIRNMRIMKEISAMRCASMRKMILLKVLNLDEDVCVRLFKKKHVP